MDTALLFNIAITLVVIALALAAYGARLRYRRFMQGVPLRREVVEISDTILRDAAAPEQAKVYALILTVLVSTPGALRRLAARIRQIDKPVEKKEMDVYGAYRESLQHAVKLTATACMLEDWRIAPRVSRALAADREAPRDLRRKEVTTMQTLLVTRVQKVPSDEWRQAFSACHG